ncbi:MAG: exodeoxyribonuclease VII small subunit [Clostridia bacterium]
MKIEELIDDLSKKAELIESDTVSIEESIKLFEQATIEAETCIGKLKEIKGKLTILETKVQQLKNDN